MKGLAQIIVYSAFLFVLLAGMNGPDGSTRPPMKMIEKAIKKVCKVDSFAIYEDVLTNGNPCAAKGCWFRVPADGVDVGRVYVGRVNSCRSGGCALNMDEEDLAFEFFDYFLLIDDSGQVAWVKVFNYQATQGHEVMSRGWLNQFRGLTTDQDPVFGEDIEALSGATVSAMAITQDIQDVLQCLPAD